MKKKKICIITGSRAEWGLFYPLATEIQKSKDCFKLQIVAMGAHLCPKFGLTYKEIERDGFRIKRKVRTLLSGDTKKAITNSVSLGIAKLGSTLYSLNPDLLLVLGDRFEIFAAAVAGFLQKIPIAHIHGGELTEGSLDDGLRHAITKMAHLHFVSTEDYKKRVIQMGEDPSTVYNVGALGIDNIKKIKLLSQSEFKKRTGYIFGIKNIMVTFNSLSAEKPGVADRQLQNLLRVLDGYREVKIIFTHPNPDVGIQSIINKIRRYVRNNKEKSLFFTSMGRVLYLSALRYMDVVVGNSSSGIIEVPSFGIPTINIGNRQKGRVRADSVIDVDGDVKSLKEAFQKAFSPRFKYLCKKVKNPYGRGDSAERMIRLIKNLDNISIRKQFYDI